MALGDTLGTAIRSCGVANFLTVVPFREASSPAYIGVDRAREWLLSLLHANLKLMRCRLADFGGTILPIAGACSQAVRTTAHELKSDELKSHVKLLTQSSNIPVNMLNIFT